MKQSGFSLIELMIVIAIVAILAAVAVPSYQSSVRKTNRQDAREVLLEFASNQEKYRLANSKYAKASEFASELGYSGNTFSSSAGKYQVSAVNNFCATTEDSCYAVQAVAQNGQDADTPCSTFILLSDGRRGSKAAGATSWSFGANDNCW